MKPRIAVFLQPQHAEYDQIRAAASSLKNRCRCNLQLGSFLPLIQRRWNSVG